MSVYKPKGSPFWHFDFQIQGRRFHGSTGCKNRREAEAIERAERDKAKVLLKQVAAPAAAMTLDVAAGRFWGEVGQYHANSETTWRDLERLIGFLGNDRLLSDIIDDDVARLVAWRRGHRLKGRTKDRAGADVPLVSAATVNRSTTQLLQAVFTRAKLSWGARFDREPVWRHHRLPEPQERVRELSEVEADRIENAIRDDYGPYFDFVRASGQRLDECLLRWPEVIWSAGRIVKKGKGGRTIIIPITPVIRHILWPLRGHHSEHVFTYVAQRTREGRVTGRRYPLTYNGVKTAWKRIRKAAQVSDFWFHDFRHDLATKLLRETGNLKLVQKALNHADIKTTTRYAHVFTEEVAEALSRVQKSRRKSRSPLWAIG
jgi:integrase